LEDFSVFWIVHAGLGRDAVRVEADTRLTPEDFRRIAKELIRPVVRARKVGLIAARPAATDEAVETRWNGTETTNTARKGDWVVTDLSPTQEPLRDREGQLNTYVIRAERFRDLYEPTGADSEYGPVHRARYAVDAVRLPGGFDIVGPWGERQTSPDGYLMCNGAEVYGNAAETFAATYQITSG
jgi:hypothetical protein